MLVTCFLAGRWLAYGCFALWLAVGFYLLVSCFLAGGLAIGYRLACFPAYGLLMAGRGLCDGGASDVTTMTGCGVYDVIMVLMRESTCMMNMQVSMRSMAAVSRLCSP